MFNHRPEEAGQCKAVRQAPQGMTEQEVYSSFHAGNHDFAKPTGHRRHRS